MNRRCFLQSILAAGVAPYVVKADALMRVYPNTLRAALDLSLFPRIISPLRILTLDSFTETKEIRNIFGTVVQQVAYKYTARATLALPPGISELGKVWAEGIDITRYVRVDNGEGIIEMPLTEFGDRLPELTAEWWPKE